MKKLIIATLFLLFSLNSFSQLKRDTVQKTSADTVDISTSKFFRINGRTYPTAAIPQVRSFLTEDNLVAMFEGLSVYPYSSVAVAITYLRKFFNIPEPK